MTKETLQSGWRDYTGAQSMGLNMNAYVTVKICVNLSVSACLSGCAL